MTNARGADISRYQTVTDWKKLSESIRFIAIRCTVGDYYTDLSFQDYWNKSGESGIPRAPYHVVAPAASDNITKISAAAQMDRFINAMGDRQADFPVILDCELQRGQTKDYITSVTAECISIATEYWGRPPIIYTRQSWFDYWTYSHPLFKTCDLFAARYSGVLTGPWSDGYYKFRDWTNWRFWQWSSTGYLPGIPGYVDMDYFNGNDEELNVYLGKKTLAQRVAILEREAALHGWNLEP